MFTSALQFIINAFSNDGLEGVSKLSWFVFFEFEPKKIYKQVK